LLYLVNQQDILYSTIKFGMMKHYPHFKKHLEDKLADPEDELELAKNPKEKYIAEMKIMIEKIAN
jgi:hypothetical protein